MIEQMSLPFAQDALTPTISAEAMHFHYDKHFAGYVKKTNAALAGTPLAEAPLESIIRSAQSNADAGLLQNAGQVWNHAFFWKSLSPEPTSPTGALASAIERDFGSREKLGDALVEIGSKHFASGWVWLASDADGALSITSTHDAAPVWMECELKPLLVCDLWEHAFYIDWRNNRVQFLSDIVARHLNWVFASGVYGDERGVPWSYAAD